VVCVWCETLLYSTAHTINTPDNYYGMGTICLYSTADAITRLALPVPVSRWNADRAKPYIQLLNVYKIFNLTIFSCAYITLQTTTNAKTRKVQCVFFGRLWVTLKKACFCGWVALKRINCLQHMFKMMPLCLHTCMQ